MNYYNYIPKNELDEIFHILPSKIGRNEEKKILSHCLGATLYMPAIKENIAEDIINKKNKGLNSLVICLEDAIGEQQLPDAEKKIIQNFLKISNALKEEKIKFEELPLIFIRVRNSEQIIRIFSGISNNLEILTGFVFPKFSIKNGNKYFKELSDLNKKYNTKIYGMPILETSEIMFKENRYENLSAISKILDNYNELVLNIRIGAADLSNLYGIRRGYDINIYHIAVLSECIGDIVNKFVRIENEFVVSGPLWEYFSGGERIMKPQLRQTPFHDSYGKKGDDLRKKIINKYIDGLIYEVVLDKANGLWGKTIIHPTHIIPVQSLYAVTHEEYLDAVSILDNNTGKIGVFKSSYTNKMNEINTHTNWANKILLRSKIFGVLNEGKYFTDLFKNYNG